MQRGTQRSQIAVGLDLDVILLAVGVLVFVGWFAAELFSRARIVLLLPILGQCIWSFTKGNPPGELNQTGGTLSYVKIALFVLAGAAGFIALARHRRRAPEPLPMQFYTLGAFTLLAVLSLAYTANVRATLVGCLLLGSLFLLILAAHSWSRTREGLEANINVLVWFAAVSTALNAASLLWPERSWWWNSPDRFQGLSNHPNNLGALCMLAIPLLLWKLKGCGPLAKPLLLMLLAFLGILSLLTGSRTTLLCAALGLLVWHAAMGQWRRLIATALLCGLATAALVTFSPGRLERRRLDDTPVNLTGRPAIWASGLRLFDMKPALGHGFGTEASLLQDPETQVAARLWLRKVSHFHNTALTVIVETGIIGLALWFAAVAIPFVKLWAIPGDRTRALVLSVMAMGFVSGLVESQAPGRSALSVTLWWLAWGVGGRLIANHDRGRRLAFAPEPSGRPGNDTLEASPSVPTAT
jgi:O-antigen ligase